MIRSYTENHIIPGGRFSTLYRQLSEQTHLLIAGRTGSGKSVVVNGIIHAMLCQRSANEEQLILVDPKRVELSAWKRSPHCIAYASDDLNGRLQAFRLAIDIIDKRYTEMDRDGLKKYVGGDVHIIIDELADLLTTQKNDVLPLLQRIGQIGRAARVHLIACTQCPTAQILSTQLRCNFDSILGLKTRSAQDSRNIIGLKGCEKLPDHGKGYLVSSAFEGLVDLPMIPEDELNRVARHWSDRKLYVA